MPSADDEAAEELHIYTFIENLLGRSFDNVSSFPASQALTQP